MEQGDVLRQKPGWWMHSGYNGGWSVASLGHWRRSSFVGEAMLKELHEHFSRSARFNLGTDSKSLSKFRRITQRDCDLGQVPIQALTCVAVIVDCGRYPLNPAEVDEDSG